MQPEIQNEIVPIVLCERMLSVRGAMQLFAQKKGGGTIRPGEKEINEEELQGGDRARVLKQPTAETVTKLKPDERTVKR